MDSALIVVDPQLDLLPGGPVPAAGIGDFLRLISRLQDRYDVVVGVRQWHPPDHVGFASNHPGRRPGDTITVAGATCRLWPDHCLAGRPGAAFHPAIDVLRFAAVVATGTRPDDHRGSAFAATGGCIPGGLAAWLRGRGCDGVDIMGLGTDHALQYTAADAVAAGFRTALIVDACRPVDLVPGDGDRALRLLRQDGVALVRAASRLRRPGAVRTARAGAV